MGQVGCFMGQVLRRRTMCLTDCLKLYFTTILFAVAFNSSQSWVSNDMICIQKGPCNCTTEDGGVISLSPLSSELEPLVVTSEAYLYLYHPCTDKVLHSIVQNDCNKGYGICYFTPNKISSKPLNVDDVLVNKTFGNFKRLALNEEGVFRVNEAGELEIVYKNIFDEKVFTTIILLHCDEDVHNYKLTVRKREDFKHILSLSSQYACKILPHHMSGTAVFFLIIFILIAIYFIGGILVLKFIRGAKGMEMIPNHEFWISLLGAAKESFSYLRNCCGEMKSGGGNASGTYETI